jgi:diguanylate cyclase
VAILDVDRLKSFNDLHGHQAGDRLLKEAAPAWRAELRPTDMLARYGARSSSSSSPAATSRPRTVVDRAATPATSPRAGIARREAGDDAAGLVRRADEALYEAKRSGRNRTQVAKRPAPGGASSVTAHT